MTAQVNVRFDPGKSSCPKCALNKQTDELSCCARGGSWFGTCGMTVGFGVDHTWFEGAEACQGKSKSLSKRTTTVASSTDIVSSTSKCPKCTLNKQTGELSCCARGGSWYQNCGMTSDLGLPHTWFEGAAACKGKLVADCSKCMCTCASILLQKNVYSILECTKCGITEKTGKSSCCASGGSWFGNCGDPGDPKFGHTWSEGIQGCKCELSTAYDRK